MNQSKKALCTAIAAIAMSNAQAFLVDGINTGGNEYSNTQDWGFYEGHKDTGFVTGSMSWGMDDTYYYVLLAAPTNFVNNAYGTGAAAASWEVDHQFKHLTGSDKMWFDLDFDGDGDGPDQYLEIDYISDSAPYIAVEGKAKKTATKKVAAKKAATKKAVAKKVATKKAATKKAVAKKTAKKGSDTKTTVVTNRIQQVATSLQYNLSLIGDPCTDRSGSDDTPVNSVAGDGCINQLMYEFSFLKTDFTSFGFGSLKNIGIHASPAMSGGNDTFESCVEKNNCHVSVPEPSSVTLLLAGIAGLFWSRRRQNKRE